MRKFFETLMLSVLCSSCGITLLDSVQIDQLQPAVISIPGAVHKVAVIDRLQQVPSPLQQRTSLTLESAAFTEQLARLLAEADYFDDIVLCDSNIAQLDRTDSLIYPLQQQHVQDLVTDLDVDLLVAVEGVRVQTLWNPQPMAHVSSLARLYIPNRQSALCNVVVNDTIVWDEDIIDVPLNTLRKDVMGFTAERMAEKLAPHWKSVNRYYYVGTSMALRDGSILARRGAWEHAYEVWQQASLSAKGQSRLQLMYNMILAREMMGEVKQALADCEELLKQCDKYPDLSTAARIYYKVLTDRMTHMQTLDLQLQRFM